MMSHISTCVSVVILVVVCGVSIFLSAVIISGSIYKFFFKTSRWIWGGRSVALIALYIIARIFFFDIYRISGYSMEPTLKDGDYIFVSKIHYGPRLPRSLTEIPWLNLLTYLYPLNQMDNNKHAEYKRLIAFQNVERNDILIFNLPVYQPYYAVKRCVGLPGDQIDPGSGFPSTTGGFCQIPYWKQDYNTSRDSLSLIERRIFKHYYSDSIISNDSVGFSLPHAYFFLLGDNPDVSSDSRMWGVLQDDHIVGKALFIMFSKDNFNQIRWGRFLKRIR